MLDFPPWKRFFLWFLTLAASAAALPSIYSLSGQRWPDVLPNPTVNLGLDLAGGSHILLEAEPSHVARQRLATMAEAVRAAMRSAEPRIQIGDISSAGGRLSFLPEDPGQVDSARDIIEPMTTGAGLTGQRDWT